MIWAVILAAGESRRMGSQKLILPFGTNTVIEAIVKTALDSSVDETLVVLGAAEDDVRRILKSYPVRLTVNEDYRSGMLSSVQAAFSALPLEVAAAVVMLGDQPSIPVSVIEDILKAYRQTGRGIIIPVNEGRRGHPLLVDMKHRSMVLGLDPDEGLRHLVRSHPRDVLEVEVSTPAILKDLDEPQDYAAEIRDAAKRPRRI